MAIDAGQGFIDIIPRTDRFLVALNAQVSKAITSATSSAASTSEKLARGATLGLVALGAASVVAIGKAVQATQEWAGDVRELQRVTGLTAESASSLLGAAETLGIGVDKLGVGFGILSKNIANSAPNLTRYGIAVTDAQGNTLGFDAILANVATRFNELPPGIQQTAFAMNVFGRSGKTLIPLLKRNADGIAELQQRAEELGLVLSQEDLDASRDLAIAQRELGHAFEGVAISVGKEFIPALTGVVKAITTVVEAVNAIPGPVLAVGLGFTALTAAVAAIIKVGAFFATTWGTVAAAVGTTAVAEDAATVATTTQTVAVEALTLAVEQLIVALGAAAVAEEATVGATTAATTAWGAQLAELNAVAVANTEVAASSSAAATGLGASAGIIGLAAIALSAAAYQLIKGKRALDGISDTTFDFEFKDDEKVAATVLQIGEALKLAQKDGITFQAALEQIAPTIDNVALASERLSRTFPSLNAGIERFGDISGQSIDSIQQSIQGLFDPKLQADPAKFLAAAQDALASSKEAWASWHDTVVDSLEGAGGALSDFLGAENVSFAQLTGSLNDQRKALREFGQDFEEVSKVGGKGAQAFLQFISENGLQAAGILDAVADKPKKIQKEFEENFDKVQGQTDDLADGIQKVLDPAFRKITLQLKNIVRAIQGLPPIALDASKAFGTLATLKARLAELEGTHTIAVQFSGGGGHALAAGGIIPAAEGGVIAGASGFITQGPTFLTGESPNMTFAGRGSEAVIPFDQRGIGILSEALSRAMAKAPQHGGDSPDIVVHVHQHLDGKELGESVTRFQQRGRMVRG